MTYAFGICSSLPDTIYIIITYVRTTIDIFLGITYSFKAGLKAPF